MRQKHSVFLFFVLIAALAWFIRALGEKYVDEITFPVSFTNFPDNKFLSSEPPEYLSLLVRTDGYTLLNNRLKRKDTILINVKNYDLNSDNNRITYINTKSLLNKLSSYLKETNKDIDILKINPDTIFFKFTELVSKKVPVRIEIQDLNEKLERQHLLNGELKTIPDSITVKGASEKIKDITHVDIEEVKFENLSDTLIKVVDLVKVKDIVYDKSHVKLIIPVDKYTEIEHEIELKHMNVPDTFQLKTFPGNVSIKYNIALSQLNYAAPEFFYAYVNFNDIDNENPDQKLEVKLDSVSSVYSNLQIKPKEVDFIIELR